MPFPSMCTEMNKEPTPRRRADSFPLTIKSAFPKERRASAPGILINKLRILAFSAVKPVDPPKILNECPSTELSRDDIETMYCPKHMKQRKKIAKIAGTKIPKDFRSPSTQSFFVEMMVEVIIFCQSNSMAPKKGFFLTRIYMTTHRYFVADPWRIPAEVYAYFRELLFRHAVQHPPKSIKVFEGEECTSILYHFHRTYLRQLPLIRALCVPNYKLRIPWKNVPENQPPPEKKTPKKKKY